MKGLVLLCLSLCVVYIQSVPRRCPMIIDYVCGKDGNTYDNACNAEAVGVEIKSSGPCPIQYGRSFRTPCNKKYNPVCGSDGETYNNPCVARNHGVTEYEPGRCSPTPELYDGKRNAPRPCTADYRPVCGSDKVTYGNKCAAENEGVSYTDGPCVMHTKRRVTPCTLEIDPVCEIKRVTFGNRCHAVEAGAYNIVEGECPIPEPYGKRSAQPCSMDYHLVCGSDGVTYTNVCEANAAGVSYTDGPCVVHTRRGMCTMQYEPVCGTRATTYDNKCLAEANGATNTTPGSC